MGKAHEQKTIGEIHKINRDLNTIKDEVMNALTDVSYIENNCHTMIYVRDGKMFIEITDKRTIDIIRQEEENKENTEPKGMATLYTIMNG